ncbi:TPA: LPXTG cell wall anchor domain-containing protein [Bacillus luti]|nr:LPXTG cell wall anchor domain-containing protein [Bacillus luti]
MVRKYFYWMSITCAFVMFFTFQSHVLAETMNSKAGITFSNSYIPSTTTDPIIPDGSTVVDDILDKTSKDKILPKTGGNISFLSQYIGFLLCLIALATLALNVREKKNNNLI